MHDKRNVFQRCSARRQKGLKPSACLTQLNIFCFSVSELLGPRQVAVTWTAEKAVPARLMNSFQKSSSLYRRRLNASVGQLIPQERTRLTLCDGLHVRLILQPKAEVFQLAGSLPRRAKRTPVPAELDLYGDLVASPALLGHSRYALNVVAQSFSLRDHSTQRFMNCSPMRKTAFL